MVYYNTPFSYLSPPETSPTLQVLLCYRLLSTSLSNSVTLEGFREGRSPQEPTPLSRGCVFKENCCWRFREALKMLRMTVSWVAGICGSFPLFYRQGPLSLPWRGSCCLDRIQQYLGTKDLGDGERVLDVVGVGRPTAGP